MSVLHTHTFGVITIAIKLSAASKRKLQGVHPDLIKVVLKAAEISTIPFQVIEGLRTLERQKELKRIGATQTLNSRHLGPIAHAVDIVPLVDINKDGKVSSSEMFAWPVYHQLAAVIKEAARQVNVPIEWGGDWRSFKDGPHWQLPFGRYPKGRKAEITVAEWRDEEAIGRYPSTDYETDTGAATKSVAAAATGGATGLGLGMDPAAQLVDGLTQQQYALSSGETIQLVVAVAIIGLSVWFAFKKAKGP